MEILPREILRATRARKHLIILMIDVDHFNSLIQCYGYQIVDCVLKTIEKRITDVSDPFDLVFRFDGDEFFAIFSVKAGEAGMKQAQSIQDTLTTQPFDCEKQSISLIVSMGIAIYPTHGNTIDELIIKAESALTQSKVAGGNQIILWSQNHKDGEAQGI